MADLEAQRRERTTEGGQATIWERVSASAAALMLLYFLLTALVGSVACYYIFQTRTNDRLDAVEARLTKIEGGVDRISDALHINRAHLSQEGE